MANKQYVLADDEFQPLLRKIFEDNLRKAEAGEPHLPLNVEPERIICLRLTSGGGKKYAYVRPIKGEYRLLTEKRYFMVFCNDQFDTIETSKRENMQKWIVLHEYSHCWHNEEDQDYETRDHDIKDFRFLLKNPEENFELVENFEYKKEEKDESIV
jgi:Zn-dependent peptidase ImmA (M78 family)